MHRVDGAGKLDKLRAVGLFELTADSLENRIVIERQRYFLTMRSVGFLFERGPADEVVIELYDGSVAEIPRSEVVIFDVVGIKTAANGRFRFVAIGREPFAIRFQLFAGVDG